MLQVFVQLKMLEKRFSLMKFFLNRIVLKILSMIGQGTRSLNLKKLVNHMKKNQVKINLPVCKIHKNLLINLE